MVIFELAINPALSYQQKLINCLCILERIECNEGKMFSFCCLLHNVKNTTFIISVSLPHINCITTKVF